jgi:hypothetical protein
MLRRLLLVLAFGIAPALFQPGTAAGLPPFPGVQCSNAHLELMKKERPGRFAACARKIDEAILAGRPDTVIMRCIGGSAQCCELKGSSWSCTDLREMPPETAPEVPDAPGAPLKPGPPEPPKTR